MHEPTCYAARGLALGDYLLAKVRKDLVRVMARLEGRHGDGVMSFLGSLREHEGATGELKSSTAIGL